MAKLPLPDHLRLSCVCRHYLLARSLNLSSPAPSSPWLILPGRTPSTLKFLPQAKTTPYETTIPSPFIRRRLFIGSSDGWLVTISCNPSSLDLHLLNPLTGTQLPLPPIHTLPFVTSIPHKAKSVKYHITNHRTFDHHSFMHYFFSKAAISTKDNFTVVLAHPKHSGATLCYTRPDLPRWISFVTPYDQCAIDLLHDNGFFYALTSFGNIIICSPSSTTRLLSIQGPLHLMRPSLGFIVKSLQGDLIMAVRRLHISDNDDVHLHDFKTCMFAVYRIEVHANKAQKRWKRVSDLADHCLFLGANESIALSAFKHPELQENCIYFTEANVWNTRPVSCKQPGRCDLGVYNLRDGSIKPLFYPSTLTWPRPIWFTPHVEESHH
ncbi:hypothetical protein DsansV1_C35g0229521 [Dioscorea sansibarensis]